MLVSQLYDRRTASGVKLWLGRYYPDEHVVCLVHAAGTPDCSLQSVPLYQLDRLTGIDHLTALYVPPLSETDNVRTFAGLMNVTRTLRGPGGCPWDREQTHASLKPHLLEETYEVLEALDEADPAELAEELGDLLFQVTIHSQVAAEAGEFTIEDVIEGITRKLIGRHPHVFGELELESAQEVRQHWETFKQREKPKRSSVLEQIPKGLPALPQSNLMQKRAASVGFEWASVREVIAKVEEELEELQHEIEAQAAKEVQREEFGDILFALVSVARHLRIDPEEALRLANRKFAARFQYVESRVAALGKSLRDLSPEELDSYWNEAKALGTSRESPV
jgi:tetrapyrrole methylase family protein/MazG family protein